MLKQNFYLALVILLLLVISGCTVRTYKLIQDRVDQDLSTGNRGYLMGKAPVEQKERKKTRTTQVVEVEFADKGIAVDKTPVQEEKFVEEPREELTYDITEPIVVEPEVVKSQVVSDVYFEKYTVQKDDTLQKISQKFFGTTKKWQSIFEANKDVLSSPDKIYPGQTINIPMQKQEAAREVIK